MVRPSVTPLAVPQARLKMAWVTVAITARGFTNTAKSQEGNSLIFPIELSIKGEDFPPPFLLFQGGGHEEV